MRKWKNLRYTQAKYNFLRKTRKISYYPCGMIKIKFTSKLSSPSLYYRTMFQSYSAGSG